VGTIQVLSKNPTVIQITIQHIYIPHNVKEQHKPENNFTEHILKRLQIKEKNKIQEHKEKSDAVKLPFSKERSKRISKQRRQKCENKQGKFLIGFLICETLKT
jgi:hypothetical protein